MALPPKSIFSATSRAMQQEAMNAVRSTKLFKSARAIRTILRSGRNAPAHLESYVGRTLKSLTPDSIVRELGRTSVGRNARLASRLIGKLAKGEVPQNIGKQIQEEIFQSVFQSAGPIADVFRVLLGAGGANAATTRDLAAMIRALQSFGFEVIHKPSKQAPPTGREISVAKRVLEQSDDLESWAAGILKAKGYTVIKPGEQQAIPVVEVRPVKRAPATGRGLRQPGQLAPPPQAEPQGGQKPQPQKPAAKPKPEAPIEQRVGGAIVTPQTDGRITVERFGQKLTLAANDPIITGEMIRVKSSNVYAIGYGVGEGCVFVQFLGRDSKGNRVGPGPLYKYYEVRMTTFQRFAAAASKGIWIWDNLRIRGTVSGHKYAYDLAATAPSGYVPRQATLGNVGGKVGEVFQPRTMKRHGFESQLGYETVQTLSTRQTLRIQRAVETRERRGRDLRARNRQG